MAGEVASVPADATAVDHVVAQQIAAVAVVAALVAVGSTGTLAQHAGLAAAGPSSATGELQQTDRGQADQ